MLEKIKNIIIALMLISSVIILINIVKPYIKPMLDKPVTTESVTYNNDYKDAESSEEELLIYSALNDDQKDDYKKIYSAVCEFEEKVKISADNDVSSALSLLNFVLADHPEIFWVEGNIVYADNGALTLSYIYSPDEADSISKRIEIEAERLMTSVDITADDYTKSLKIYELVARNVSYDDGNLSELDRTTLSNINGAFISRNAICGGYTKMMQYLLKKAGMRAAYVSGQAIKDDTPEGHAWLLHEINGKLYYSDPTWADCYEEQNKNADLVSHTYFGMSYEDISKDHIIEKDYPVFTANYDSDNYYVKEGLYLNSYSLDLIYGALNENTDRFRLTDGSVELELRFSDESQYNEACQALFEDEEFFSVSQRIDGVDPFNVTFSQDDFRYCIMIYLSTV